MTQYHLQKMLNKASKKVSTKVEGVAGVGEEVAEGVLVEVVEGVLVEVVGEAEGAEVLGVLTAVWIKSGNGKVE